VTTAHVFGSVRAHRPVSMEPTVCSVLGRIVSFRRRILERRLWLARSFAFPAPSRFCSIFTALSRIKATAASGRVKQVMLRCRKTVIS
jgi:hypothetical protein